jgi:hypothetical protein
MRLDWTNVAVNYNGDSKKVPKFVMKLIEIAKPTITIATTTNDTT